MTDALNGKIVVIPTVHGETSSGIRYQTYHSLYLSEAVLFSLEARPFDESILPADLLKGLEERGAVYENYSKGTKLVPALIRELEDSSGTYLEFRTNGKTQDPPSGEPAVQTITSSGVIKEGWHYQDGVKTGEATNEQLRILNQQKRASALPPTLQKFAL